MLWDRTISSVSVGDCVHLDTPFTGQVDGNLITTELLRLPVDQPNEKIE